MEVTYRLDAEKFSSTKLARVKFVRKDQRRDMEASVVEDSLTMNEQTHPNSVCHTYIAHVAVRRFITAIIIIKEKVKVNVDLYSASS